MWVKKQAFCGSWDVIEDFRAELSHFSMLHLLFLLDSIKFASSNKYGAPITCQELCRRLELNHWQGPSEGMKSNGFVCLFKQCINST